MAKNELLRKIELLNEYEAILEELKAEADEIKNDIKAEMEERGVEEMEVDQYMVRYTSVLTTRFDTKRFKEAMGADVYNAFTKQVASRRFSIA
jgi:predicted phage-related endonuclease